MDRITWDFGCFLVSTSVFGVQITPTHLTALKPNQSKSPSAVGEFPNAQLTADLEGSLTWGQVQCSFWFVEHI